MTRTVPAVLLLLVLAVCAACSGGDGGGGDNDAEPRTPSAATSEAHTATESPRRTTEPERPPHPVSLPALMEREYDGRGLRLVRQRAVTSSYTQHEVRYRSGDLTVSGVLNVPHGRGPFPVVVLAHGYIDPAVYVNGQGMIRELDWFGRNGYVTLHVDYRNHAFSDDDPDADVRLRLGYTEDVISAVQALRRWSGPVDDDRVALVGRSMGGGVTYNVLTVRPGLVDAAVVFAPVSSDTVDNFERWIRPDPGRAGLADRILDRYGEPARNRAFWRGVSPRTYFDRVTEPVLIHHGTSDDTCPIGWSRETAAAMRRAGVDVTLAVYPGEEHAFVPQWPRSMERTGAFLRRHLR